MKRFALLLASTAFVTPALAADVIYDEPPAPAPMMIEPVATTATWTGIYIGGQAGVAFSDSDSVDFDADNDGVFGDGTFDSGDDNNAGFIGGAHIGYDHQFANNVVLGAVADINYIDAETNRNYSVVLPGGGGTANFGLNEELDYMGTVRARLGYAFDSILVYGTGGLAYAGYDRSSSMPATGFAGYTFEEDGDDADVGYTVGGGIDVMATQNISFGVEYLYTNLGSNDYSVTATNANSELNFTTESNDDDLDFHTIWAKASYRFN
ncbi:MAG: outer membrane beta-barrel protein [Aurantimonas endophytica]|jgi:outer membrane immunogenic protein|uniref:Outer membrane immunogenic protein n=1 Tax=Aurantimonas endophytica TaxID=1522175 RepID=A0A7W6HGT3_9HYPH|nr:outer membrane beta-barrel protein [Aurantimonas endophytica]MBB4004956.1 outer membrane immunogenic protein [Aurantimonas endophytica]MCO6405762.1 outer membrane beta-barrel protein [Aurantimonas endophytica]